MTTPLSSLRAFWAELRRRHVVRVAIGYLAAAFVVLQAADLVVVPIGLPQWVYTAILVALLLGFPVALTLAWSFDVTAAGLERAAESFGDGRRSRRLARAGLALVTVAASVAIGLTLLDRLRTDIDAADRTLAVLPFTVHGKSSFDYLGQGLVDLLSRNLDGAGDLRSVAPEMVLTAMESEPGSALAPRRAQEVARRLGARWYVLGSVNILGDKMRISAALHDQRADPSHPLVQKSVEGDTTALLELVDQLSAEVIAARSVGAASQLTEIAARTTASLPALKQYLRAEQALRSATFDSAVAGFDRATQIDTGFALAYYRAAWAAATSFPPHEYVGSKLRLAERALLRKDRLAARERALVEALTAWHRGQAATAEAIYREILEDRPGALEAMFGLGNVLFWLNPPRGRPITAAKQFMAPVLEGDPSFLCPI